VHPCRWIAVLSLLAVVMAAPGETPKATSDAKTLLVALKDLDPQVRRDAAFALAYLVRIGREAIPDLVAAVEGKDELVRVFAVFALAGIDPAWEKKAVEILVTALKSRDELIHRHAADELMLLAGQCKRVVPGVIEALQARESHVRAAAVRVLGTIRPAPREVIRALSKALQDSDDCVIEAAVVALENIGAEAREAVPALVTSIKKLRPELLFELGDVLHTIGPASQELRETHPLAVAAQRAVGAFP